MRISLSYATIPLNTFPSHTTKKIIKIIALTSLLIICSLTAKYYKNYAQFDEPKSVCIDTLKQKESIKQLKPIQGGYANNLWLIKTHKNSYVLRCQKQRCNQKHFSNMLKITQKAADLKIGPEVICESIEERQMLLRYIEHIPWPSFNEIPQPYLEAMKAIKNFHDEIKMEGCPKGSYAPFKFILENGLNLKQSDWIPIHFNLALERINKIFQAMKPWLEKNAIICHGDFHRGNVLLEESDKKTHKIYLIDFDSYSLGHPFFDIVKFSISLSSDERFKLFCCYLGNREPTIKELAHFNLMDLALLMVVIIVRFTSVQQTTELSPTLTKEAMEKLLDLQSKLPSFLDIPFSDQTIKARQLGALYALSEFLIRTEEPYLSELLSHIN